MMFQLYGETGVTQILGWVLVFAGLIIRALAHLIINKLHFLILPI